MAKRGKLIEAAREAVAVVRGEIAPPRVTEVSDEGRVTVYKYRDAAKWRAYMRDYMRRKRAEGKDGEAWQDDERV